MSSILHLQRNLLESNLNIFFLDTCPKLAAQAHIDTHIVKMPTELAQICSTVYQELIGKRDENVYKPTHSNHPSTKWAKAYESNLQFTILAGIYLCEEYKVRYKKQHSAYDVFRYISEFNLNIISGQKDIINFGEYKITPPALAMPEKYKSDDPVKSYRDYYIAEKTRRKDGRVMMDYTEREPPTWLEEEFVFKKVKNKTIMKERKCEKSNIELLTVDLI